jgi:hypothetical protein
MSFQENEVVRDKGGKFAEKTGTAPETSIGETIAVPTCPRCGGPWGADITCEECCDDNGEPRPIPLELVEDPNYSKHDEIHPEDITEAEQRLAIDIQNQLWPEVRSVNDQRVRDELVLQADKVQKRAKVLARMHGPARAFKAGEPHYLDTYLDDIFEGKTPGFSKESLELMLQSNEAMRRGLVQGNVRPRDVIGTGYRGDTRKLANQYLDNNERSLKEALETRGRANAVNVSNARHAHRASQLPRA